MRLHSRLLRREQKKEPFDDKTRSDSDIDAKFEYSNTVKILFSSKINITIYPNPVIDKLKIQIPGSSLKWMSSIYDAAGKLIYQQMNTAAGNLVEINITALAKGNYVLVLNNGLETFTGKFLKQ